jgi:hypothetical protein
MTETPRKYELIRDPKMTIADGSALYRIRALREFSSVKLGDLGGWVQSESNLSHEGECWVADGGMVIENARVSDDATVRNSLVFGHAQVSGNCIVFGDAQVGGSSVVAGMMGIVDGKLFVGEKVLLDLTATRPPLEAGA